MLRQQLAALPPWQLRAMIVAYELAEPSDLNLGPLNTPELIKLIVRAVRTRLAA